MGRANGLEFLINAASMLKQKEDIQFVVIGDGSEKGMLLKPTADISWKPSGHSIPHSIYPGIPLFLQN